MWTPDAEPHDTPFGGQRRTVDKDLHKLIVRQWQEPRAVLMYILQGRAVAPLAADEVAHMLRRVVNPLVTSSTRPLRCPKSTSKRLAPPWPRVR